MLQELGREALEVYLTRCVAPQMKNTVQMLQQVQKLLPEEKKALNLQLADIDTETCGHITVGLAVALETHSELGSLPSEVTCEAWQNWQRLPQRPRIRLGPHSGAQSMCLPRKLPLLERRLPGFKEDLMGLPSVAAAPLLSPKVERLIELLKGDLKGIKGCSDVIG